MGRDKNHYGLHPLDTNREVRRELRGFTSAQRELPWLADVPGASATIDKIMAAGDAVIFGATSDGGAVSITVLSGKERRKRYAATEIELEEAIAELERAYEKTTSG